MPAASASKPHVVVHWFRRDLRLHDNHALFTALSCGLPVLPIFIFDTAILNELEDEDDRRVDFIHRNLKTLKSQLEGMGSSLLVLHGKPKECWTRLLQDYTVSSVFTNHDHEPYAQHRDNEIAALLEGVGIEFRTFKDISIFERTEVLKDDGTPYTVFTPYSRKWKSQFSVDLTEPFECSSLSRAYLRTEPFKMPQLREIGFTETDLIVPAKEVEIELIRNYHKTRDIPAIEGTSRLSVHLRFGTVSPREITALAFENNEKFLNELIWREFYMTILFHFPHAAKRAFRPKYDRIEWEHNEAHYEAWCNGETGYPIVDAGMRQLNRTGFMHNRVRMVVASFFTKHLLLDWRLGEAYFARKLLDFELSSNNGGWQWAAGSGCDAAPYFRVFNPELQQKKFDPNGEYVRYWAPEYGTNSYPAPIVEHKFARNRAIERYKAVLKSDN